MRETKWQAMDRKHKRSFDDETNVSPCIKVVRFWLEMKLPEFWGHRRTQRVVLRRY